MWVTPGALTALDTDTTVDATGYCGILTAATSSCKPQRLMSAAVTGLGLTGVSKNDTFNVTTAMTNDVAIDGNGGTDTNNGTRTGCAGTSTVHNRWLN